MQPIQSRVHFHDFSSPSWRFFCPFCRLERKMAARPTPNKWIHFFQIGLTTGVTTLACFPFFGWKGLVTFLVYWMIFETVYRLRTRAQLVCPECGFDPYLYLTDLPKARDRVEETIRLKWAAEGIPWPEEGLEAGEEEHLEAVSADPEGLGNRETASTTSLSSTAPSNV